MVSISYSKLWESEDDNIVSERDKLQDMIMNQIKFEVHGFYKEDEKITTNFEAVNVEDVLNKAYLDEKLSKLNSRLSKVEEDYIEFKIQHNKQSVEEVSIQRAVKTTIHILYDKGLFDIFQNADKVLIDLLFVTRRDFMTLTIVCLL